MPELAVVVPVYNEEGSISDVVKKWTNTLDRMKIDYRMSVYDDGSRDATGKILERLSRRTEDCLYAAKQTPVTDQQFSWAIVRTQIVHGSFKWTVMTRWVLIHLACYGTNAANMTSS